MRHILAIGATLLALNGSALAADAPPSGAGPVKAPPVTATTPAPTDGWYWGIEAGAGVQSSSSSGIFASSLVTGNLNADGGAVGGCVGYMHGQAAQWLGFQACLDYLNITAGGNAATVPAGIASRWEGTVEVRWGGANPITVIQGTLGNLGVGNVTLPTFTPVPPNGVLVQAAGMRSYIAGGLDIFGVSGQVGTVNGAQVAFAPMLKIGAIWPVLAANGTLTGSAVDVSAAVSWPMRGLTIDDVGGTVGAPVFMGGLELGTRYMGKVAYLFPVPH